jgi:hypothetical protein
MDMRFMCWVPESGYEWGMLKGDRQLRWTEEKQGGYAKGVQPPPGLFRRFAGLRAEAANGEAEILGFANQFGDILSVPGSESYQNSVNAGRRTVRKYATLNMWRIQVRRMRWAVELWDRLKNANESESQSMRDELLKGMRRVLCDMETPSCTIPSLSKELKLVLIPTNLLASMWLTLAQVVSGDIEERPCSMFENCHSYLYIGNGPGLKKRGDVDTCSAACRKQKSRLSIGG